MLAATATTPTLLNDEQPISWVIDPADPDTVPALEIGATRDNVLDVAFDHSGGIYMITLMLVGLRTGALIDRIRAALFKGANCYVRGTKHTNLFTEYGSDEVKRLQQKAGKVEHWTEHVGRSVHFTLKANYSREVVLYPEAFTTEVRMVNQDSQFSSGGYWFCTIDAPRTLRQQSFLYHTLQIMPKIPLLPEWAGWFYDMTAKEKMRQPAIGGGRYEVFTLDLHQDKILAKLSSALAEGKIIQPPGHRAMEPVWWCSYCATAHDHETRMYIRARGAVCEKGKEHSA